MSLRTSQILSGLISLLLFSSLTVFGIKVANGALRPRYQIEASFAAAGQGLIPGSDVKIHGVNIGRVTSVRLREGRALVRMAINDDEKIPLEAKAIIRPKTLFGEKFVDVDPGQSETTGPFLADEGVIKETLGGFELEKVLSDAYPILQAIHPAELAVVLDNLAEGARGSGPAVNRQIVNFRQLAEVQARHDADTRQFLDDFALLTGELAERSDDLVAGARDLNAVLPELNTRGDQFTTVLDQASRLSGDLADLLEANRPFLEKNITLGGRTLQTLYDRRGQIPALVVGFRQFFEVLASVGRIDFGDGTKLAAVKWVLGEDCPGGRIPGGCPPGAQPAAGAAGELPNDGVGLDPPLAPPDVADASPGAQAILDLLTRLVT